MFIVLGSDGVWEFLSNSEVMDMVIANGSTTKVEDTADQLMELACDAWYKASLCRDDITLIVVKLQESKL